MTFSPPPPPPSPPFPYSISADLPSKNHVTELVCLAIETSTGRQLGRFLRFVRVDPPAQKQQPRQQQPQQQQQQHQQQPQYQQPQYQHQQQQQAPPFQASLGGGGGGGNGYVASVAGADSGAATRGSLNPLSTALPMPELLQELQQWMISLGLGPGLQDEAGFAERGNFRYAVCTV